MRFAFYALRLQLHTMHTFPIHKRIYYRAVSFVYGFTYWTNRHRLLGFRFSTMVKALAFGPLLLAWRQNRSVPVLGMALLLGVWVLWLYWRAKRVGHKKFVVEEMRNPVEEARTEIIEENRHIALKASGVFGVSDREERILLCPAEYWRVPMGEHTIMAQREQGGFVYQFFSAATLQNVQKGWLLHGLMPKRVTAVTFLSSWGAEPLSIRSLYQGSDETNQNTKSRTIYLCFEDKNDEQIVWRTIVSDVSEKQKS